ncbi:MAG: hypothetical protein ACFFD2_14380 [Promethearchaeota archaeon]
MGPSILKQIITPKRALKLVDGYLKIKKCSINGLHYFILWLAGVLMV